MFSFETKGDFKSTEAFLRRISSGEVFNRLDQYGREGVAALASATPVDSGLTAESWTYEVTKRSGRYGITWKNTNVISGVNVAILIQYGHATGTGGYVEGRDFINPVIQPLFDRIAEDIWKAVRQ